MDPTQETHYAELTDALQDEADKRGWLPSFLPATAHGIRERHDLDTNERWLHFRCSPADIQSLLQALPAPEYGEVTFPDRVPEWWPEELRKGAKGATEYRFRRHVTSRQMGHGTVDWLLSVAVDERSSDVWCWGS